MCGKMTTSLRSVLKPRREEHLLVEMAKTARLTKTIAPGSQGWLEPRPEASHCHTKAVM